MNGAVRRKTCKPSRESMSRSSHVHCYKLENRGMVRVKGDRQAKKRFKATHILYM